MARKTVESNLSKTKKATGPKAIDYHESLGMVPIEYHGVQIGWGPDVTKAGKTAESGHEAGKTAKVKRHPDLTIDRAILFIDAIGGSRLKSADRNKLAEVVAFLTGDSVESVRQRYAALNPENETYKGNTESGVKALQNDLKLLSYYFDLIGLRGELKALSDKLGIPSSG